MSPLYQNSKAYYTVCILTWWDLGQFCTAAPLGSPAVQARRREAKHDQGGRSHGALPHSTVLEFNACLHGNQILIFSLILISELHICLPD